MRKLITMSLFALSSMMSFAGNGEKEILPLNLNPVKIENLVGNESPEFFSTHNKYRIEVWFYISDGEHATSYGQTIIPETQCLDDTNIEILRSSIQSAYQAMNPNSNLYAHAILIEDCGW